MKRTQRVAAALITGVCLMGVPGLAAANSAQPPTMARTFDVTFVKHLVDAQTFKFCGQTGGAAPGSLVSQLITQTAPPTSEFEFVEFRWTVSSGRRSFVAVTDGTLDTVTGVVSLTGTVTSGWHKGAEVIERGQLIDPATETFAGDIVLLVRP